MEPWGFEPLQYGVFDSENAVFQIEKYGEKYRRKYCFLRVIFHFGNFKSVSIFMWCIL